MSFPMSPSHPVPTSTSISQKLAAKNAAHRFKYGSPKIRDQLREKCRIRIKEARNDSFIRKRNIVEEEKNFLSSVIREELAEIEKDIELQELIYKELMIIDDPAQWFYEANIKDEMEEIEKDVERFDENPIFCPICEKSLVEHSDNIITCKCGLRLYYPFSLASFYNCINIKIKEHETKCPNRLQFFIEPKSEFRVFSLHGMCSVCDNLVTIVD